MKHLILSTLCALCVLCGSIAHADPPAAGTGSTIQTARSLFGSVVQDTANLAGMHNDWHTILSVSGSGTLVASGSGYYLTSGSSVPLASGSTSFSLSGSNAVVGGATLSGTTFLVSYPGAVIMSASAATQGVVNTIMAGVQGPTLYSTAAAGTFACSGTDDWATFQALLNTGTSGAGGLIVYIDSDFAVSNTPIIKSNTKLIGVGTHMWHMNNCCEPGLGTILSGATISSSNMALNNIAIDCNAPGQATVRQEGAGFLQGANTACEWWVFGSWLGSCVNVSIDGLTIINAGTFANVWTHAHHVSINRFRNIWTNQEGAPENGGMNHDGIDPEGDCSDFVISNSDLMGDDDAFGLKPVELSPEGSTSGLGCEAAESGTIPDIRAGHGGPITDFKVTNTFLRNAWDFFRLEGLSLATGTGAFENTITNISFIDTTGTTFNTNDNSEIANQIGRIRIDGYGVVSGSSVGAAAINLPVAGDNDYELSNISSGTPVYFWPNNNIGLAGDPATWTISGDYAAELHGLRNGCVAAWSFNTDTSGSAAYDWSGNGAALSNTTSVVFASGTMTGNAAIFNGTNQFLYVSGTTCPNIAKMPAWTIAGWAWHNAAVGTSPAIFTLLDGTSPQIQVLWAPNGWSNPNGLYADVGGSNMWPGAVGTYFPNGHWCFFALRKRPADGAVIAQYAGPAGLYTNGWVAATITGTTPKIEIGGSPEIGTFMAGMMDNVEVWNRCLTDREILLLNNPGTDGASYISPPYAPALYGGREWPFNY